jgi:hypothetical protein
MKNLMSSPMRSSTSSKISSSDNSSVSEEATDFLLLPTMTNESRGTLRVGGRTAYYQAAQLSAAEEIEDRCVAPSIADGGIRCREGSSWFRC